jgi:hypothetical protein
MEIVNVEAAQHRQPNPLSGDAERPRVADDFEAIHARVEELRRQREHAHLAVLPSCDTKRWLASRKAAVQLPSWSPIRVRRMDDNINDPVTIEAIRTIELNAIGV